MLFTTEMNAGVVEAILTAGDACFYDGYVYYTLYGCCNIKVYIGYISNHESSRYGDCYTRVISGRVSVIDIISMTDDYGCVKVCVNVLGTASRSGYSTPIGAQFKHVAHIG